MLPAIPCARDAGSKCSEVEEYKLLFKKIISRGFT
jgi:hypothetical protein